MLPHDLKPEQFRAYLPQARKLVLDYLSTLQRLPLSFLPNLLREAIDYDLKFPAERKSLEKELVTLSSLSGEQLQSWLQGFEQIHLSSQLENADWVNAPAQFVEQLSAHLWGTHQLDAFRKAALDYADRLQVAMPPEKPVIPRLGIAVIGLGVAEYHEPLFRKLRAHGAYFTAVKAENGLEQLLQAVAARAKAHPTPFAHWYIDGGTEAPHDPVLTCISYAGLVAPRAVLLAKMRSEIDRPGMGPEALRTFLARLRPADIGLGPGSIQRSAQSNDVVLDHFQLKLLTEGSGTQIFSTTFAQWATREILRRAQPLTILVRFAPRQRQRPMNELLSAAQAQIELDPVGSLIDADMGAYYHWLNQQRLAGAEYASFLVWFEDHNHALVIGPGVPRGTQSTAPTAFRELLSWAV